MEGYGNLFWKDGSHYSGQLSILRVVGELARVVRAILPEEIAVTLHHSEGHRAIILLPVKIVGLIVLENPPAVGKRVIANIGRLSSPDTSVHLQVPSQAWGSPNIDRCLKSALR